jgi:hypothetical protein
MYDYGCPVNWNHPLNRGLVYWFHPALQNWWFGNTLYNLTRLGNADLTNVTRTPNTLVFNGTSSEGVVTPFKPAINFAKFTALIEYQNNSSTDLKTALSCASSSSPYAVWNICHRSASDRVEGSLTVGGVNYGNFYGNTSQGRIRHTWCFTYDGETGVMYEDGVQVTSIGTPSGDTNAQSVDLKIGNAPGLSRYFSGSIYNIRILTRAYTAGEAMLDYKLAQNRYVGVLNDIDDSLALRVRKRPNSQGIIL